MASAASLNATATIVNGHGLGVNTVLLNKISTYQAHQPITLLSNICTNAIADGNVGNVLSPIINTIGNTATYGHFLLDIYPANVTPATSGSIGYFSGQLPRASTTILSQANYPFTNGLSGFVSGFTSCLSAASQAFDTIGSLSMLNNKTYGQSGLGYTGIVDLLTGGIGSEANLLGSIVSGWGTMYDVTNINLISDPYVFGQNLLNQGLGKYGNLSAQLSATGLNINDITQAPLVGSVTYPVASSISYNSLIGPVSLPTVANTTVTTNVTGNNPNVIMSIYSNITGKDLAAIVSATGFVTNDSLVTLADYLDFNKVVGTTIANQLTQYNVRTFKDFTTYLNSRIGQQQFNSWTDVSTYLASISVPVLSHTTTTSTTPVLNPGTASTLGSLMGTGSGPFGNPVMSDYLGAVAGIPYNDCLTTINSNYGLFAGPVLTAIQALDKSVIDTYTEYYATVSYDANGNASYGPANPAYVTSNVNKVNSALNALTANTILISCQTAYYTMLNRLSSEVSNLNKAGANFTNYGTSTLMGFGQGIGGYGGEDTTGLQTNQIINNLITDDAYGDTIRAVISEQTNSRATVSNDPNPRQALANANSQGIPLSTYLSQNK